MTFAADDPRHGTRGLYNQGCRCDRCRAVQAEYARTQRARRVAHKHGTASGYRNQGCRCAPCKQAGAKQNKEKYPDRGKYYSGATDETRARSRRYHAAAQAKTLEGAGNRYKEWTGPELEIASRRELSAKQVALMLGRTVAAVKNIRRKLTYDPRKINAAGVSRLTTDR